ncbi:carbohydrate esterase family 4 protein [Flagelloscypha sp. PMI_526]|nr:carbohydrate esterase family 4 protein [Flagelloscypha sp. PMI_526]
MLLSTTLLALSFGFLANAQLAQVVTKCTVDKTVAITLDDGPYKFNKELVDLASKNGAKLTFFVNGNNYGCIYNYADQLNYAKSKGHQIASHTWAHKDLATLTLDQVRDEMSKTDLALQRILGVQPAFMRPPYGSYNDNVRKASKEHGQKVVIWDFDSGDSVGKTPAQSKQLYKSKIDAKTKTLLTLNHETIESTAKDVLPYAIAEFKKKGYRMVTVAECLGEPAYQWTKAPQKKSSSWVC